MERDDEIRLSHNRNIARKDTKLLMPVEYHTLVCRIVLHNRLRSFIDMQ